jgi:hypothetical protein
LWLLVEAAEAIKAVEAVALEDCCMEQHHLTQPFHTQ